MKFGDFSPIAGIATGEGLMGKLSAAGGLGQLPAMISRDAQGKREEEEARNALIAQNEEEKRKRDAGIVPTPGMKKGGKVKKMASGGSASKRADGIAVKGKTRGTMITMKSGGRMC
jgi:hypothetical protein